MFSSLSKIFFAFFKIGSFSFGGGYAMVLIIQREIVEKQKWLSIDEFIPMLGLAQSAPGPMVVNTAIMVGYHLRKKKGAFIATLGTILPSFLIMLIIALVFTQVADNEYVVRAFKGIRPAIASLILTSAIVFATRIPKWSYSIAIATALSIFFGVSPLLLILLATIFGVGYTYYNVKKIRDKEGDI